MTPLSDALTAAQRHARIRRALYEFEIEIPQAFDATLATDALAALDELVTENQQLRGGIEDYLLWEPGRTGHAEAHRKLAALVEAPPRVEGPAE